eukprot:2692705-Prymnesium_polylepis.1
MSKHPSYHTISMCGADLDGFAPHAGDALCAVLLCSGSLHPNSETIAPPLCHHLASIQEVLENHTFWCSYWKLNLNRRLCPHRSHDARRNQALTAPITSLGQKAQGGPARLTPWIRHQFAGVWGEGGGKHAEIRSYVGRGYL